MSNLIERLRAKAIQPYPYIHRNPDGPAAADALEASEARIAQLEGALRQAAEWFEQYAVEHYAKAKNAPDYREQHSREVKGKTNADRAKVLRTALRTDAGGGE